MPDTGSEREEKKGRADWGGGGGGGEERETERARGIRIKRRGAGSKNKVEPRGEESEGNKRDSKTD